MAKSKLKKVAEIDWVSVEKQLNGPGIELRKQMREDGVDVPETEEERVRCLEKKRNDRVEDLIYEFGFSTHMYCPHENGIDAKRFGKSLLALVEHIEQLEIEVAKLSCKLTQK